MSNPVQVIKISNAHVLFLFVCFSKNKDIKYVNLIVILHMHNIFLFPGHWPERRVSCDIEGYFRGGVKLLAYWSFGPKRWIKTVNMLHIAKRLGIRVMVFNATFNNISVISWRSVLLVEETGVLGKNYRPTVSHWQTLSHNVVSSTHRLSGIRTDNVSVVSVKHWLHR